PLRLRRAARGGQPRLRLQAPHRPAHRRFAQRRVARALRGVRLPLGRARAGGEAMSERPAPSDAPFLIGLGVLGGSYVVLIVALLAADAAFSSPGHLLAALRSREIRYAVRLSLLSCSITAILSVWVGTALGYLMSRYEFPGKRAVDALLDVPI